MQNDHFFRITSPMSASLILPWGPGRIVFHADGRLVLEGYDSLDAAAQAFWEAVQRWKPLDWTVTLPWQQEGASLCR